ncbi:MAG: DICT sensory domain-containing protein [Halobacteriales archaeon]|nr:DICT sensory domain-containing protein [Halobacteriales archaeon]
MALSEIIESIQSDQKTLTVYNHPDSELIEQLRSYFDSQNVEITTDETPDGAPKSFAVLSEDGQFLTSIGLETLEGLVGQDATPTTVGVDPEYNELLGQLDDTTFTSYDRKQMLYTTREIEDRAWRAGRGRLIAGFQNRRALMPQVDEYEQLAQKDITIDIFTPVEDPPAIDGVSIHPTFTEEIEKTWFVAFDGAGMDIYKCALLAEERDGTFHGFWTYDPDTVDRIFRHIEKAYGLSEAPVQ